MPSAMNKDFSKRIGRAALFATVFTLTACGGTGSTVDAGATTTQYLPTFPSGGGGSGGGSGGGTGGGSGGGSGTDGGQPPLSPPVADLRVDTNRDGVVSLTDLSDDQGEDGWTAARGAIFLANIDDDLKTCPTRDSQNVALSDAVLAQCNDAADAVINGTNDLLDLARIHVIAWPQAPADAAGDVSVPTALASRVRLFRKSSTTFTVFDPATQTLSASELQAGVELAIEAKDIVRDADVWDGKISVTLRIVSSSAGVDASDTVQLRVSPVMLFHHNSPVETLYATNLSGDPDSAAFRSALQSKLTASNVSAPLSGVTANDQWTQDFFETGYMSMPTAAGGQHSIRVNFRSSNVYGQRTGKYPLRPAGRFVFTSLRGKDVAGAQQVDLTWNTSGSMNSLNSFGNTETIPPYTYNGVSYPMGRIIRGSISSFQPDPSFAKMLAAQAVQPLVAVDTSWLLVSHIDETVSFIPANTPRGWMLMINDPTLARQMLEAQQTAGNGNAQMFVGKFWDVSQPATATISEVLADPAIMSESAAAAAEIGAQLDIIKTETGITDAEIIRVPFLHYPAGGGSLAYQPGTVNGVLVNPTNFISPDPFGPVIGGKDIFKDQLQTALGAVGVTVHFVDDWDLYHALSGEVHCGTNAARAIPSTKWWESGR